MRFYLVRGIRPWGDYGDILVHGMTGHLSRKEGPLRLEWTGPFIPPITLPGIGDVVVTDEFRAELERSGLGRFGFHPVIKARIVELHWEQWDRTSERPAERPEGGEPEN